MDPFTPLDQQIDEALLDVAKEQDNPVAVDILARIDERGHLIGDMNHN